VPKFLICLVCFVLPSLLHAQSLETRLAHLAEQIEQKRIDLRIPGIALAVVRNDTILLSRGFGVRNVETQDPVNAKTLFPIGSATKAFTATLVGMLVDEEKLGWDDPVTQHLPYFKLATETPVTLRDLLCHRTGFGRMALLWAANRVSRQETLEAATQAEPVAEFRKKFVYSNVMYIAAGEATSQAAGVPWTTLLQDRILTPLGMGSSNASFRNSQSDSRLASGYLWDEEKERYKLLPMRDLNKGAPAGAINSNLEDMSRWIRFQLGRGQFGGERLISLPNLLETWEKQIEINSDLAYAMGWMLRKWNGRWVITHGGNVDGFASQVGFSPELNLGFVLLTNVTATPLQADIMPMVFNTLFEDLVESREMPPREELEKLPGEYEANFGPFRDETLSVLYKEDKLVLDVPGQRVFKLKPPDAEGRWHFVLSDQIWVRFNPDSTGVVLSMTIQQSRRHFELPRLNSAQAPEIPLDALKPHLGTYRSEDPKKIVYIQILNNRLAINIPKQAIYELSMPGHGGRWSSRVRPEDVQVQFHLAEDGTTTTLTLFEEGEETTLTRVAKQTLPPIPPLDDLLARLEEAHGSARISQVSTTRMTGSIHFVNQGLRGTVTTLTEGLDRFYTRLDFGRFGNIQIVLDRHRAWTESGFSPLQELTGKHLEHIKRNHPLRLYADLRKSFETIKIIRADTLDTRDVFVVKLAHEDIPTRTLYIDAETAHLLKLRSAEMSPGIGTIPVTVRYEDYRDVAGLRLPFRIVSKNSIHGKAVIQFSTIETDVQLPPDAFTLESTND
jgi:CubicO group peptidase (beta-lactamase class C family)